VKNLIAEGEAEAGQADALPGAARWRAARSGRRELPPPA
jgi:hypothetical protein